MMISEFCDDGQGGKGQERRDDGIFLCENERGSLIVMDMMSG